MGNSELVVGLLEEEENWVSHTQEKIDKIVSDLQIWSPEGKREAGAGVIGAGRVVDGVGERRDGWRRRDFLAGVEGAGDV